MIPWSLLLNKYVIGALAIVVLAGGLVAYGAHWQAKREAAKSATETIDNLQARGKIDAGLANASKDDLCQKLEATRWDEETKECV